MHSRATRSAGSPTASPAFPTNKKQVGAPSPTGRRSLGSCTIFCSHVVQGTLDMLRKAGCRHRSTQHTTATKPNGFPLRLGVANRVVYTRLKCENGTACSHSVRERYTQFWATLNANRSTCKRRTRYAQNHCATEQHCKLHRSYTSLWEPVCLRCCIARDTVACIANMTSSTGASTAEVYGFAGYLTSLVAYGKPQCGTSVSHWAS